MTKQYKVTEIEEVTVEKLMDENPNIKDIFNVDFANITHKTQLHKEILLKLYEEISSLKSRITILEKKNGI